MDSPAPPDARPPVAVALVLAAAMGALSGGGLSWYLSLARVGEAAVRPPIAIVDFSTLVLRADGAQRSPEEFNAQMLRVKRAVEKLRHAGFLVIDSQSVLGAPESLYVPMDRLE